MSDDFIYKEMKEKNCLREDLDMDEITNNVLRAIDNELVQMGASLSDFSDLPTPPPLTENEKVAQVMKEEIFNKRKKKL